MKALFDWIDHRTGIRSLTKDVLFENIPGGSRWRYVWGSTLTFTIFVQFITGPSPVFTPVQLITEYPGAV